MSDKPVTHLFRYVALGVGAVGLGLLYLSALHREIPAVRIGDIKPSMNFATVRVSGEVSRDARLFREGEHIRALRFSVSDGTGEIHVQAQKSAAQALVARFGLPREGDRVEAVGSLDVSDGSEVVMRLQVPESFVLTRAEIKPVALKEIDSRLLGRSVVVEGIIKKVLAPKSGSKAPWTMVIGDSGGQQEITFWQDIYDEIQNKVLLAPGAPVRARVEVRNYKDELQLALGQGMDIEFLAPAAAPDQAPLTPAGAVTRAMAGKTIKVTGRVAQIKAPEAGSKAPYEVTLQDDGKDVCVVYWDAVAGLLDDGNKPFVGALMTVKGQVNEYKDKLQIKIEDPADLTLVDVRPASAPQVDPAREMEIGSIKPSMAGRGVTVRGELGEPRSIRGGVVYPLRDGSGSIMLVLWDKTASGPVRDDLSAGSHVVVSGKVTKYKGDLEVVPDNIEAIRIVAPPSR